jgi:hypothetical protein
VAFGLGPLLSMPLAKADGLDVIVDPIISSLSSIDPMLAVDMTSWLANADAAWSAVSSFDPSSLGSAVAAAGVDPASVDAGGVTAAATDPAQMYETEVWDPIHTAEQNFIDNPADQSFINSINHLTPTSF